MFRWFESRLDPFPETRHGAPPQKLFAFAWHYAKDAAGWLALLSILTAMISAGEVVLFGFLGAIVDWLATADRAGFMDREGGKLVWMGALVLVGLPATVLLHSMVIPQVMLGNFPMSARWRMHRRLLGQSLSFFANEFAG
ncbi:MAG: ABC transporter ATP-binding protein, partial [Amphiplicatus sp.]